MTYQKSAIGRQSNACHKYQQVTKCMAALRVSNWLRVPGPRFHDRSHNVFLFPLPVSIPVPAFSPVPIPVFDPISVRFLLSHLPAWKDRVDRGFIWEASPWSCYYSVCGSVKTSQLQPIVVCGIWSVVLSVPDILHGCSLSLYTYIHSMVRTVFTPTHTMYAHVYEYVWDWLEELGTVSTNFGVGLFTSIYEIIRAIVTTKIGWGIPYQMWV